MHWMTKIHNEHLHSEPSYLKWINSLPVHTSVMTEISSFSQHFHHNIVVILSAWQWSVRSNHITTLPQQLEHQNVHINAIFEQKCIVNVIDICYFQDETILLPVYAFKTKQLHQLHVTSHHIPWTLLLLQVYHICLFWEIYVAFCFCFDTVLYVIKCWTKMF